MTARRFACGVGGPSLPVTNIAGEGSYVAVRAAAARVVAEHNFRDWIVGDSQRMCAQFPPCNNIIHLSQEPSRQVVRITKDTRGLYPAELYVRMRNGTSLG